MPAPAAPLPANYDLTHKLASTFSLRLPDDFARGTVWGGLFRNSGLFATARFNSGLPYTRQPLAAPARFSEPSNSSRRGSEFRAELRVTRFFEVAGSVELGAIFEVFNLFNNENLQTFGFGPFIFGAGANSGVYNTTGSRLLEGREELHAEQLATDTLVIASINPTTPSGRLTRQFREFADIDGDGIVYPDEQRIMALLAFGAGNEIGAQPKRSYRLGIEVRF